MILFVFADVTNFSAHWKFRVQQVASRAGTRVHVVLPTHLPEEFEAPPEVVVHAVPFKRGNISLWRDPQTILALSWLIWRLRPIAIHAVTIKPVIYGGILSRLFGIKARFFSITGLGYAFISTSLIGRMAGRLARAGYRLALGGDGARVIFENPEDRDLFLQKRLVSTRNSRVHIGGGLNLQRFAETPEPNNVIPKVVLVGRMLKDKGVREFVEAARTINSNGIKAEFVLVGDVDELNPATLTRGELSNWQKQQAVTWLGWRNDVVEIIQGANVICLPSYREGAPRSLMEAMACGRACIAADVPGCRHVVKHGHTGLLVPPRDTVSLTKALKMLLEDVALRHDMGRAGREVAMRKFTNEGAAEFMLSVYNELFSV